MEDTTSPTIGERLVQWAMAQDTIPCVVQIGSRARLRTAAGAADEHSDWDFQVVADQPEVLANRALWEEVMGGPARAFVVRTGTLGVVPKLTAIFPQGMIDVVILPTREVIAVRELVKQGAHTGNAVAMRALVAMASVLLGGYQVRKGEEAFGEIYRFTATQIPAPRLSDAAACALAEGFVCDYEAGKRLLARGELAASQRTLHLALAETNFRLLHELRQRQGASSYPDARRLERNDTDGWAKRVTVDVGAGRASLTRAADVAAEACRELMRELVGTKWQWPDSRR